MATAAVQPTPKVQLQQWFQYLQAFQIACEEAYAGAYSENLFTFANDMVATDLPTVDEQETFINGAQAKTSFTVTTSDIASSSTFESLLETVWNPLSLFVLGYIKSCAPPPYVAMGYTDFAQQPLASIFPLGIADPNWANLQNGLTSSIPSACYSNAQQIATQKLVAAAKSTVQNLVDLISKLG
jgi:hypothetical protein